MAGQTLSEIRSLLAAAGLSPQHRFGQNFLIDLNLMRKLLAAAELSADDVALEVGPGTGSLTELLLESGARVIAVEIDRGLQSLLEGRFGAGGPLASERFRLVAGDALAGKHQVAPAVLDALLGAAPERSGRRKLVANLPYQIATPLLIELLLHPPVGRSRAGVEPAAMESEPLLERMCVTIQREVGERFTAAPRTGAYGPVSVLFQTLSRVESVAILPPSAFWPRPKVESVMLCIRPRPAGECGVPSVAAFAELVQHSFRERRKMMRRVLREGIPAGTVRAFSGVEALAALEGCAISGDRRPEELSPDDWRRLASALHSADRG